MAKKPDDKFYQRVASLIQPALSDVRAYREGGGELADQKGVYIPLGPVTCMGSYERDESRAITHYKITCTKGKKEQVLAWLEEQGVHGKEVKPGSVTGEVNITLPVEGNYHFVAGLVKRHIAQTMRREVEGIVEHTEGLVADKERTQEIARGLVAALREQGMQSGQLKALFEKAMRDTQPAGAREQG